MFFRVDRKKIAVSITALGMMWGMLINNKCPRHSRGVLQGTVLPSSLVCRVVVAVSVSAAATTCAPTWSSAPLLPSTAPSPTTTSIRPTSALGELCVIPLFIAIFLWCKWDTEISFAYFYLFIRSRKRECVFSDRCVKMFFFFFLFVYKPWGWRIFLSLAWLLSLYLIYLSFF